MNKQDFQGWEQKPNEWELNDSKLDQIYDDKYVNIVTNINCDYIFVLAGGLDKCGHVHIWVKRRLDQAIYIYKNVKKMKIICFGGGTYHKPPIINKHNYVIHESTACAEYLINNGVESIDIYKEWSSYDTIANAYFALTNYIIPLNISKYILITSDFHFNRACYLFEWVVSLYSKNIKGTFIKVSDENIDKNMILLRKQREKISLSKFILSVQINIGNLKELAEWFYENHKAYCSQSEFLKQNDTCEIVKKSY